MSSTKSFKDFYNEECEKQALKESKFNSGDSKIRLDKLEQDFSTIQDIVYHLGNKSFEKRYLKLGNEVSIFLRQLRDYIQ